MSRHGMSRAFLAALLLAIGLSSRALAADGWWGRLWHPLGNASRTSMPIGSGQPGDPAYGRAMGVPTYAYGYFGAQTRPHEMGHKDYHSDFRQTFTPARR